MAGQGSEPAVLSRLILGATVIAALAALIARARARRGGEPDERLALKHHSRANRAYRFSLPPQLRPK